MKLPEPIINKLMESIQQTVNSPKVYETLAYAIMKKTGERLGDNTVKRLIGLYPGNTKPRPYTLDVIARYLDEPDYDSLLRHTSQGNSHFIGKVSEVSSSQLAPGQMVQFTYHPDRSLCLRYLGDEHYTVVTSENSKLRPDDNLHIRHFILGFPLIALEVIRDGQSLGSYTAAEDDGLITLEVL